MNLVISFLVYVLIYVALTSIIDRKLPGRAEIISGAIGALIFQAGCWFFSGSDQ